MPVEGKSKETNPWLFSIAFLVGITSAIVLYNVYHQEEVILSTIDIINLSLSLSMGGASIALAIVAIRLGKASEQVIVSRSDAAIQLQTKVYSDTIEALQQIKSSTGVTEKRIEDIIAGRVGEMSKKIAQEVRPGSPLKALELQEEIQRIISEDLGDSKSVAGHARTRQVERRKQIDSARLAHEFEQAFISGLIDKKKYNFLHIGSGDLLGSGYELMDCVFKTAKGKIVGITSIYNDDVRGPRFRKYLVEHIMLIVDEIKAGKFDAVFVVFAFENIHREQSVIELTAALSSLDAQTKEKFEIITGTPQQVVEVVSKSQH
ncbi:MAG: hypothetical protein QOD77_978 [Thermoplasmata archaeon]|jgi:hypothetical protein|nr:hypothetical protein [Thermoplasmata archaeon]